MCVASELAETAFWEWDFSTGEVWRSENHHRLFGLPERPSRWNVEVFLDRVHPEDRSRVREFVAGAMKPQNLGRPFLIEFRVRWPDGSEHWLMSQGRIRRDITDRGPLMTGAVTNITEKKRVEERLRESERRFRELTNIIPQILWVAQADGRKIYANDRWYEYTGLTPAQSVGDGWKDVIHPDDLPVAIQRWNAAVGSGQPVAMEERLRSRQGEYRWFLVRATPVRDPEGRICRWYGTNTDIHEQLRTMEDLRSERDLRERMVAMLSHDLRSPLTAAKAAAELILRQRGPSPSHEGLAQRIVRDIDRADRMIRDLLDASRVRAGRELRMEREPCDLVRIAGEVIEALSTIHGPRFSLHAEGRVEGLWDADGIKRVLENLLSNAVKYGDAGRPIDVTVRLREGRAEISVHNWGNPISRDDLGRLFQPYNRTRSAERSGQKGWGLGLTLVQGVVAAHGGRLSVRSDDGQGTTFRVELPLDFQGAAVEGAA